MLFDDSQILQGFNCVWRIEDFTFLRKEQIFFLKSQIFKVNFLQNSKYHLELCQADEDSFSVVLYQDDGPPRSELKYSLFLLTRKGFVCVVQKENRKISTDCWIRLRFVDSKNLDLHQNEPPNSLLTLSLTIHKPKRTKAISSQCFMRSRMVHEHLIHSPKQEYHFLKQSDFVNFSDPAELKSEETATDDSLDGIEDIICFFKEKGFRFVTLRTADRDFTVHKALLCAKSPVFNAMFEKEMRESSTGSVDVDDIDSDTLSSMLQFMHLEPLKDLKWEKTVKLYYAADKYQVIPLREMCASLLKNNLSNGNVCEAIALAHLHDDEELKRSALKNFCDNSKAILRSTQWKDFMRENPDLAFDTLHSLADRL